MCLYKHKKGAILMELELFTVSYKENGAIGIEFNEDLLQVVTQEELFNEMDDSMNGLAPIVSKLMKFMKSKSDLKEGK